MGTITKTKTATTNDTLTLVEQTSKVIVTEYSQRNNNFCIEEARIIIRGLANLVNRTGSNKLTLGVATMKFNCTFFCCPRLELHRTEDNKHILIITDGRVSHNLSPRDNINSLRKIKKYALMELL